MAVDKSQQEQTTPHNQDEEKLTVKKAGEKVKHMKAIEEGDEELSEEDQQLKNELEMLVERLKEDNASLHPPTLETLKKFIKESTSSVTSVPKPLKFLRPHYNELINIYEQWNQEQDKRHLADIISVLAMSYSNEDKQDTLKYRLLGNLDDIESWGHEYVRHLSAEIGQEFNSKLDKEALNANELLKLALRIVPFFLKHNAEADAVDLLLEMESIDHLVDHVDKDNYQRVCLYMVSCVNLLPPPDDVAFLNTAHTIYRKFDQYTQALALSIRLGDEDLIQEDFNTCSDPVMKKQMAFILARQQLSISCEDPEIVNILNNTKLSEQFISLAKELDVLEPKVPQDYYKTYLENHRSVSTIDSAKQNLASTFVNAFINVGFGQDKLMMVEDDNNSWIYKNKDQGMLSAAASLGLIMLWDIDNGLAQIDKYLYTEDENIKAGALMGIGLVNIGIKNENDPALALLSEYLENKSPVLKTSAILGLGLAYAGTQREEFLDLILPFVSDTSLSMEIASLSALALGLIFVGSCHGDITSTILQTLMERSNTQLKDSFSKLMGVGLALLYLSKQEAADATLETLKVIEHPIGKQVGVLVQICAYAGTGNVLQVQQMLHLCNEHLDTKKEDDTYQAFAVIGVALISMGEEIGSEMALRTFSHLMHYGEPTIRKTVPLALGLLCASNPLLNVLDTLSKYSHDNDLDVAINSIFAMGLVGAGTNNARLAQMLRQLASYHYKESNCLFMVRIAQGLLHMGKGTMSIKPYHFDRSLLHPNALAGLLATIITLTDSRTFIFGKYPHLLYLLAVSIYPRFLITFDENLNNLGVPVRVGQAVDVVGQVGRPKTITGFQTHTAPVLLAHSERAELATEEYISLSHVLEGFVILKKNPDFMEEDKDR